jgi:hypothetical protein
MTFIEVPCTLFSAENFPVRSAKRYDRDMSIWNGGPTSAWGRVKAAPLLVRAGAGCGLFAGVAVGLMIGPASVGLVLGIGFGLAVGLVCGIVMDREDKRSIHRGKELDDIIGVTSGSLGTPSGTIPPPPPDENAAWLAEWLTPPPPATR